MRFIGDGQPSLRLPFGKKDPVTRKRALKKFNMWDIIGILLLLLLAIDCGGDLYDKNNPDPPTVIYEPEETIVEVVTYVDRTIYKDSIIKKYINVPVTVTKEVEIEKIVYIDREIIKDSIVYVDKPFYLPQEIRIDSVVTYPNRLYGYVSSSGLYWRDGDIGHSRSLVSVGLDYTIGKNWVIGGFLSKSRGQNFYYMNAKVGYKLFEHKRKKK